MGMFCPNKTARNRKRRPMQVKGDRSVPKEIFAACLSQLLPRERIIQGPKQIHNLFQTMNLLLKQESVEKVFISPEDRAKIAFLMEQYSPVRDKLSLIGTMQSTELSTEEQQLELNKIIVNEHVSNAGDDSRSPDNNKECAREELQMAREDMGTTREEIEAAREDTNNAREEMDTTREEMDPAREEMDTTREEIDTTREELNTAREEIGPAREEMDPAREELNTARGELNTAREGISGDGEEYRVGCKVCGETIIRERYHYGGKSNIIKKTFLTA